MNTIYANKDRNRSPAAQGASVPAFSGGARTRRLWAAAALLLSALMMRAPDVRAAANPTNDSAGFTVRLTPRVDMGVVIDTAGSSWSDGLGAVESLAAMDLGTTYLLSEAVKVTIVGNFNNQELEVQGSEPADGWTLGTDSTDAENKLRLFALFGRDGGSSFAASEFSDDTHLITTAVKRAGQPQADEGGENNKTFEALSSNAEYADLDNMTVGTARLLWLRADTPSLTTYSAEQAFSVTVTAVSGAGQ